MGLRWPGGDGQEVTIIFELKDARNRQQDRLQASLWAFIRESVEVANGEGFAFQWRIVENPLELLALKTSDVKETKS